MTKTIYTIITTIFSCCLIVFVVAMCIPSVYATFTDSTVENSQKYAELKQKYSALNLNIDNFDETKISKEYSAIATTSEGYNTECPIFDASIIPSLELLNNTENYLPYRSLYHYDNSIFNNYFSPEYYVSFDNFNTRLSYMQMQEDGTVFHISTILNQDITGLYTVENPVFYYNNQKVDRATFETQAMQYPDTTVAFNYLALDEESKTLQLVFACYGFNGVYTADNGLFINLDTKTYNCYGTTDNFYSSGFSHWPESDWETSGEINFGLNIYSNSSNGAGSTIQFISNDKLIFNDIEFTKNGG